MTNFFDLSLASQYKKNQQKVRVMSEAWIAENMYCACCGNRKLHKNINNSPAADFFCDNCGEIFELKSKRNKISKKIADGAYRTAIERISGNNNPDLLLMSYSDKYAVTSLTIVPKFFFTTDMIEPRKPLPPTARRAGWQGCNILLGNIPHQGKISIIENGKWLPEESVLNSYAKCKTILTLNIEARGWLIDILNCVNAVQKETFELKDIYKYIWKLKKLHPQNNNIEAKIRQQLQVLRNKGLIIFCGNGIYKKKH